MLKDKTWKKSTDNRISIDELGFITELNSQQVESVSGGGIGGYWDYTTGQYVTVDYIEALLNTYPPNPLSGPPYGYGLSPEARDIYSGLQGIFTYLPNM